MRRGVVRNQVVSIMNKRNIFVGTLTLFAFVLGAQIFACLSAHHARMSEFPPNFGNFIEVRAVLENSGDGRPYTFVVVGDPRSPGTFEDLARDIHVAHPAFVVILGDWVDGASGDWHAYYRQRAAGFGFACPVFFTPGNHDVDPKGFPLEHFEKEYGPSNFSFAHNGDLFIFISHLDKRFSNRQSLEYLGSFDQRELAAYRNRFVFMHIPPCVSPDIQERHTADEKEFERAFEALGIDYVLAADFHGYNRTSLGNVEYIVTGGGGARLHESRGRQFHHAVGLTVGPGMVSERIIPASAHFKVHEWLDMNLTVHVGPFILKHHIVFILLNIITAIILFAAKNRIFKNS